MSKEEENEAEVTASGCPRGYTMINGRCVEDITPDPPLKTDETED